MSDADLVITNIKSAIEAITSLADADTVGRMSAAIRREGSASRLTYLAFAIALLGNACEGMPEDEAGLMLQAVCVAVCCSLEASQPSAAAPRRKAGAARRRRMH